jgi:hypothetical protein
MKKDIKTMRKQQLKKQQQLNTLKKCNNLQELKKVCLDLDLFYNKHTKKFIDLIKNNNTKNNDLELLFKVCLVGVKILKYIDINTLKKLNISYSDLVYINKIPITYGNSKINKKVAIYSQLLKVSCGKLCNSCYAIKSFRLRYNVRLKQLVNIIKFLKYPDQLKKDLVTCLVVHKNKQLKKGVTPYFRINVSGDILSVKQYNFFKEVVTSAKIETYTYSKNKSVLEYYNNDKNKVFNIVSSYIDKEHTIINYHTKEKVNTLKKEYKVQVCKCASCFTSCYSCLSAKTMLFIKH